MTLDSEQPCAAWPSRDGDPTRFVEGDAPADQLRLGQFEARSFDAQGQAEQS
jgi:hypothetical protein